MARQQKIRHGTRRGVVLLIVLTLLTLLLVIGLTFTLVTGHYRRSAEEAAKSTLYESTPQQLADRAVYQVLRDTSGNENSSLFGHSLLRDLYGNDGVRGVIDGRNPIAIPGPRLSGEWIEFAVVNDLQQPFGQRLSRDYQAYTGCVLTMLDGPAAGLSTRIVSYSFNQGADGDWGVSGNDDDANGTTDDISERVFPAVPTFGVPGTYVSDDQVIIRVEAFETDLPAPVMPVAGNRFLINGHPFNGTGFGLLASTMNLDATDAHGFPIALVPHFAKYDLLSPVAINAGGADESYDLPDYQNMILAMVPPTATLSNQIIPSLHRPALINYWQNFNGGTPWTAAGPPNYRTLRREVIFRPMPWDHPNFDGSNSAFWGGGWTPGADGAWGVAGVDDDLDGTTDNATEAGATNSDDLVQREAAIAVNLRQGPWDIDNDGDGVPDSIWVDLGFPVSTSLDGRRYKPLVAILCKDLDGRLNLNAHSQIAHLDTTYGGGAGGYWPTFLATYPSLARGLGIGPAEIFLGSVLSTDAPSVLLARNANVFGTADTLPGRFNTFDDPLSAIKNPGLPNNYTAPQYSSYGTPPDTRGLGAIVLDRLGQPNRAFMGMNGEIVDDPYELLTNQNGYGDAGASDVPFTVAEMERLLRYNDVDMFGLPSRLTSLASAAFANRRTRENVTTISSYIPSPAGFLPQLFRNPSSTNVTTWSPGADGKWGVAGVDDDTNGTTDDISEHGWSGSDDQFIAPNIVRLFTAKLLANGVPEANIPNELNKLIPFELAHGERLNVNRLFGNGQDDNGNNVVDEYAEAQAVESAWTSGVIPAWSGFGGVNFDHRNNDPIPTLDSRQILARHLYCLLMLLADQSYIHPLAPSVPAGSEALTNAQQRELTARRLAQWAINVVDYRDSDAIMTPFEYDVNPFNGWTPNGDLGNNTFDGADRRVVWGCEYPEALLTETLAFHDRRVKDTDLDVNGTTRSDTPTPDDDLDQYRIPQGSLFLEVYATRNRNEGNPIAPAELYQRNAGNGEVFLDLARMAPASNPGGVPGVTLSMPVWRVAISQSHKLGGAIDSPKVRRTEQPNATSFQPEQMSLLPVVDVLNIERYVWFANVDPTAAGLSAADAARVYWNRSGAGRALVKPCSYAVVGPRTLTNVGSQTGNTSPPEYMPSDQALELAADGVHVHWTDGSDQTPEILDPTSLTPTARVLPAQTMVCAANPPTTWTNAATTAPNGIGISVTEPLTDASYYPEPTQVLNSAAASPFPSTDAYYDYAGPAGVMPDAPFDSQNGRPLEDDSIKSTGTTLDYKTAFLQRLANPLRPWNPPPSAAQYDPTKPVNPYITVDWEPIDVTVYSGEDREPTTWSGPGDWDPDDTSPTTPKFETRERNGASRNIWSPDTQDPSDSGVAGQSVYFDYNLIQTLGYLNQPFGATLTLGTGAPSWEYVGAPANGPFPWLAWNNRPYATPLELLNVPASTASRLLHEYSLLNAPTGNVYDPNLPQNQNFFTPYSYLLNFYQTDPNTTTNTAANLYAIFDYLGVPSPYVGTEKWFNPVAASTAGTEANTYRPPFNRMSRFRDPGRVNINTIFDTNVLDGILKGFPSMASGGAQNKINDILQSRQGYGGALYALNLAYPTRFANPFRGAGDAGLGPRNNLRHDSVEGTLLRRRWNANSATKVPLFDFTSANAYNDTSRNPYFRYMGLQRLGNMVSTTSNAYAVWITIGYFEVEPNPFGVDGVDVAHPDGLRLAQELGRDTGTVKRHRAFYIIDRSIPVAYQPGENFNVDRAILLRRFIE